MLAIDFRRLALAQGLLGAATPETPDDVPGTPARQLSRPRPEAPRAPEAEVEAEAMQG